MAFPSVILPYDTALLFFFAVGGYDVLLTFLTAKSLASVRGQWSANDERVLRCQELKWRQMSVKYSSIISMTHLSWSSYFTH